MQRVPINVTVTTSDVAKACASNGQLLADLLNDLGEATSGLRSRPGGFFEDFVEALDDEGKAVLARLCMVLTEEPTGEAA